MRRLIWVEEGEGAPLGLVVEGRHPEALVASLGLRDDLAHPTTLLRVVLVILPHTPLQYRVSEIQMVLIPRRRIRLTRDHRICSAVTRQI